MVPTYEYQCDQCHRTFEVRQRITADPLTRCEACGGPVRRLLSAAPFILKGAGWYVTDYPSEARKKARESEKNVESEKKVEPEKKPSSSAEQSSTSTSGTTPTTSPSTTSSSSTAASSTASSD